ncbi:MAG: hypothetical protein U9Q66_01655 [Patescibacteria group bacterium]|nr:hypothetical protein [Patescibacteria group bacterium]
MSEIIAIWSFGFQKITISHACHFFKFSIFQGIISVVSFIAFLSKNTFRFGTLLKSILVSGFHSTLEYFDTFCLISESTKLLKSIQAFFNALQITSVHTHSFSGGYPQL